MKSNLHKFYIPQGIDPEFGFCKDWSDCDVNWKKIEESDKRGKEAGTLLGRYYDEPVADGKAIYIITKVNKRTCKLELCRGIGDDWSTPMLGEGGNVDIDYIKHHITYRDKLDKLFS